MSVLDKSCTQADQTNLNVQLQRYINNNIRYIFDSFFTLKRKMMAIVACINLRVYRKLVMRYKIKGKVN